MTIKALDRERLNCPWCRTVMPMTYAPGVRSCTGCRAQVKVVWSPPPDRELKAVA